MTTQETPCFYSPDFNQPKDRTMWYPPEEAVQTLNREILELHPKKELIIAICTVVFSIFLNGAVIAAVCLGFPYYSLLGLFIIAPITILNSAYNIDDYKKCLVKCSKISKKILKLPIHEFTYLDRIDTDGELPIEKFRQIRKHLEQDVITDSSICLKVRRQRSYKISGGERDAWSNSPIQIKLIETKNNQEAVLKRYRPWIDLLLAIERSDSVPDHQKKQICKAIGWIIHKPYGLFGVSDAEMQMKLSNVEFYYVNDNGTPCIEYCNNEEKHRYSTAEEFANFLKAKYELNINAISS